MDRELKKWFFNLDERMDRIDEFYNKRIKKLEDKVDKLEAQERAITKVINMNAEEMLLKLKMLVNVLSAMKPNHSDAERILTDIMKLIDDIEEYYKKEIAYGKDY